MFLPSCVLFGENLEILHKSRGTIWFIRIPCGLHQNTLTIPIFAQGERAWRKKYVLYSRSDAESAVRHQADRSGIDYHTRHSSARAVHGNAVCLSGAGQYIAGGYSYQSVPVIYCCIIRAICMRVTSSLQHEIGTFCFGISGLQLRGLPEGHFTRRKTDSCVRRWTIDHMQGAQ